MLVTTGKANVAMQFLFTIFCTLQGCILFVFHYLGDAQVRKELRM